MVWVVARVVEVRTMLYTAYTVCVITSCIWGLTAPWIVRGRFWADLCSEVPTDPTLSLSQCSTWNFSLIFLTLLRVPFQANITFMLAKQYSKDEYLPIADGSESEDREPLIIKEE